MANEITKNKQEAEKKSKPETEKHDVMPWTMIQNVLMHAIDKGQLVPASLVLAALIILVRLPPADLSKLVFYLIHALEHLSIWAYILLATVLGLWKWQFTTMSELHKEEIKRMSDTKSELQENQIPVKLESTKEGDRL